MIDKIPQVALDTKDRLARSLGYQQNTLKLSEWINSKYNDDLMQALKVLYQYYLYNKDLTVYISRIINLLPRDDIELKRQCQILLVEFASSPYARTSKTQGDVLLLAIAPIYKDLTNFNTCIKLSALKALPGLKIPEIIQLMLVSLKQQVTDKNSLVRRVAALTIYKLWELNKSEIQIEEFQEQIAFLFKDTPSVRQATLHTLKMIEADTKLTYMHKRYHTLVKDLTQLSQLDTERALNQLHDYCLLYFKDQNDKDLIVLLNQCEVLLKLPYPGVIVAITKIYLDYPQEGRLKKLIKTLIRFLNISSESKYVILQTLLQISLKYSHLVKEHFRSLTIIQIEKLYCKILKLEILQLLIDEHNFSLILEELLYQAKSSQPQLVAVAVKLLSKTTQKYPQFLKRTVRALLDILKNGPSETKNHVIAAFCNIMNTSENNLTLLATCLQNMDDINDIRYKAAVIKMLRLKLDQIPTIAAEHLRKLRLKFPQFHENIKYEILLLSNELVKIEDQRYKIMHQYYMTLSQFDQSYLIRDLHRTLQNSEIPKSQFEISIGKPLQVEQQYFQVGSLSNMIGFKFNGYQKYEYLGQDTSELRKVIIEQAVQQPKAPPTQAQQKQNSEKQQAVQQIQTPPQVKESDKKKVQKQVDEEVKKQYNLEQVLDDFFSTQD